MPPDVFRPRHLALRRWLRRRRFRHVLRLIDAVLTTRPVCRILDIGGTQAYWTQMAAPLLAGRAVDIILLNLRAHHYQPHPFIRLEIGDACDLPAGAFAADLVHSNSVIEHVGGPARIEAFAAAIRRAAPSYFVQTPNYWFPYEPHFAAWFFHWRSEAARAERLMARAHAAYPRAADLPGALAAVREIHLLDAARLRALFPDGRLLREWIGPCAKSLMAVRHIDAAGTAAMFGGKMPRPTSATPLN